MTDREMLPVEDIGPNFEFAFDNPSFSNTRLIIRVVLPAGLPLKSEYELTPVPSETDFQESAGMSPAVCKLRQSLSSFFSQQMSSSSGTLLAQGDDEYSAGDKVRTIHINSAILASKSPFFLDLFSKQTGDEVALDMINAREEAAFINLLRFMYGMTLPKNMMSTRDFTDLLIVSQKLQVSSCVKYCCESMRKSISLQSAPFYFCLPSITSLEGVEEVQQLINECKRYAIHFWNKIKDPIAWLYSLPLKGIEALLSSDDLQVQSEDYIYDFVCTWACLHYPKLEERQQFLRSRLDTLVRLPNLSSWKLKQILISDGILDSDHRKDLALNSLFHKVDDQEYYRDRVRQRDYLLHPVKFLLFDSPTPGCVVYLDLKKEQFARLYSEGRDIITQPFSIGEERYRLRFMKHKDFVDKALVSLVKVGDVAKPCTINFLMATRTRNAEDYVSGPSRSCTFCTATGPVYLGLTVMPPWSNFLSDDEGNPFFIEGIFHLRVHFLVSKLDATPSSVGN
ncbi:hypothetical protein Tsubulata_043926 [Turnera subulata]|uniref:BTB domain-containing protein n=1 Tax=Turnera subulata TaxID=218843 RepID=A0A9Q0JBH6_9ROSI|nr:hypothetical protein Tsubulata_043926 [Turnera subulata]